MDNLHKLQDRILDDIVKTTFSVGVLIICNTCGKRVTLSREDVRDALAGGWPQCHGATMSAYKAVTQTTHEEDQ